MRRMTAVSLALAASTALAPEGGLAQHYGREMMLTGAPDVTEVSGYHGTPFALSATRNDHAMFAISSEERRDQPCWLWLGTEHINDQSNDWGAALRLCGGERSTDRAIRAEYHDRGYFGPRVFVTGIRVCTNAKGTRVKGFQLRGKAIGADGLLSALAYPENYRVFGVAGGGRDGAFQEWLDALFGRGVYQHSARIPGDYRTNCKSWKKWVDCPSRGQVATGVVGHFEAGDPPRALTGVALQCRHVSGLYRVRTQ